MFPWMNAYKRIFIWTSRITPVFLIPICISTFLTASPLTNVAFWASYIGLISCICVQAARKRNNRYLLIPFVLFKFAFIIFIITAHFFILTHTIVPPSVNHLLEFPQIFASYLHFVLVVLLNTYLVVASIAFMYLSLTVVYDIEYVRLFGVEINVEQQAAEQRELRRVDGVENAEEL